MTIDEIVVEAPAIRIIMGDMETNYQTMLSAIKDAATRGVDLIALPEMATCGYAVGDELEMDRFLENNRKVLDKLVQDTKELDIAVAMGFVDYDKEKTGHDGKTKRYNAAAVFQKGEIKGTVHKNILPSYTLFDERRWFTPGHELPLIEIDIRGRNVKLGVGICEMKWTEDYVKVLEQNFQDFVAYLKSDNVFTSIEDAKEEFHYDAKFSYVNPAMAYKEMGAELLVWLNASPFHAGKVKKIDNINKARVRETGLPLIDVNPVAIGDNNRDLFGFSGESSIMGSDGKYIASTMPWEVASAVAKINLTTGLGERIQGVKEKANGYSTKSFRDSYVDEVLDGLIHITGQYARLFGIKTVIESLSGGIDSAVGTAIAVMAKNAGYFDQVIPFTFPTQFNTDTTKNMAHQVASNLGLDLQTINIQKDFIHRVKRFAKRVMPGLEYLKATIGYYFTKDASIFYSVFSNPVTPENIQARIRSEWMKEFSNEYGALEFVNPNKSERQQGYTTLSGDMAGDIAPIADCRKWLVRALAERINDRFGKEVIDEKLIYEVNPSAELSSDQNPEKGGGDPFHYTALDVILNNYTFGRQDVPNIVEDFKSRTLNLHNCPEADAKGVSIYDKFTPQQFEKLTMEYLIRCEGMRFKNVPFPMTPKATRRAIGFEFRTPVTSRYQHSLERRQAAGFY